MTWNYRVIESQDPISPAGETLEELKEDLKYYQQAVKRPVLKREEIKFADMDIE